jgi:uncharacterized membrane protein
MERRRKERATMKVVAVGLGVLVLMVGMAIWSAGQPGVATVSAQTSGCPSCHGAAGKQPTIDAEAKTIKGHPATAAKTVQQCVLCHTKGPTPTPFRMALHKIHLNSKTFASAAYKGTCTSCHSVDKATGTITVFGLQRP